MANETVFKRYHGNPVVTAANVPRANSIHNSAVVRWGDAYAGVFRVDQLDFTYRLHVGFSKDGINWDIDPEYIRMQSDDPDVVMADQSYDPRVVEIEGTYYVTWCNCFPRGPGIGLAWTKDFKTFHQMEDPFQPPNRNAVLFPRKLNGNFAIFHRPSDFGQTPYGDIYYTESPDLTYWGKHRYVFGPGPGWQSTKVGAGPAPIETKEGWLLIYHGVWNSCRGYLYYAGGALLDLEKPWKVIHRTKDYLLGPTMPYERVGDVPNVIFPSAAITYPESGMIRLYYGCADTCVSMAEAKLDDLVEFVRTHSF
jgi:beta-1,4-mannooligosaccharide/beta-1,4-mannosyl-N-acetylglucosamine phosphorylase